MPPRDNPTWLRDLRRQPPDARAVSDLLTALRRGLARGLGSRRNVTAEDIEDFAQNAVIRVLERLDGFRGDSRFTTWATSIAIRLALTQMRKRAWGERSLEDLGLGERSAVEPRTEPDPGAVLDRRGLARTLRHAIDQDLTPRQRRVILAELSGMPAVVVAEQLGSKLNAVYKLYHDARKKLRRALEDRGISASQVSSMLAGSSEE